MSHALVSTACFKKYQTLKGKSAVLRLWSQWPLQQLPSKKQPVMQAHTDCYTNRSISAVERHHQDMTYRSPTAIASNRKQSLKVNCRMSSPCWQIFSCYYLTLKANPTLLVCSEGGIPDPTAAWPLPALPHQRQLQSQWHSLISAVMR